MPADDDMDFGSFPTPKASRNFDEGLSPTPGGPELNTPFQLPGQGGRVKGSRGTRGSKIH